MINILIPLAGKWPYFDDKDNFPGIITNIDGKPLIQIVIENLNTIKEDHKFIFIVQKRDCEDFFLDDILKLITDDNCEIIIVDSETKGAAASALLATKYIDNDDRLIISNGDQLITDDINKILEYFDDSNATGGIISFESIHPRWSYARLDDEGNVTELTAKRPISKNAIAGFYFYNKGKDFVEAAKCMIRKDTNEKGLYYVSPTMNELILKQMKVINYTISTDKYFTFYSPQRVEDYLRKGARSER